MKRTKNGVIQLCVLAALGGSVVLTLLLPGITARSRRPEPLEVSVVMRQTDNRLWAGLRMGMEQASSDLGVELRFLTPEADNDPAAQEALLRREAQRGTDAMVVLPADTARLQSRKAELVGEIPLVTLESETDPEVPAVSPDNALLGEALAQLALEDSDGRTVLLMNNCPSSDGAALRAERARLVLQQAGVAVESWPSSRYADLDELVVACDVEQIIAVEAASTLMLAEKYADIPGHPQLYGVGTAAAITAALDSGTLSGVAAWSEYAAGYLAVEQAADAARGKEHRATEPLRFTVVREEEMYEPENQKLFFPLIS